MPQKPTKRGDSGAERFLLCTDFYVVSHFAAAITIPCRSAKEFPEKNDPVPGCDGQKIKIVLCNAECSDKSRQNVSGKNSIRSTKIVITKK